MLQISSRYSGVFRGAVALGVSLFGVSAFGVSAQATTLTGTFDISIYQAVTGSNDIHAASQQALESNPLLIPGNLIAQGTFSGPLNLLQGGSGDGNLLTYLSSSGATLTGSLATSGGYALSSSNFNLTSVFVITGATIGGISGTITHDDGIGLYNSANSLVTDPNAAVPTASESTGYVLPGGAFTLVYVEANGLPAILDFDVTSGNASTTPLPAGLPLFASGLGLVGLLAKRRKKKLALAA